MQTDQEKVELELSLMEEDELYIKAKKLVFDGERISEGRLQRRLNIENSRAIRLIDMLSEAGHVYYNKTWMEWHKTKD